MFKSIPARTIAAVYPAVLGAGGNPLGLNTNILDGNAVYPNYEYSSAALVGSHYGLESDEYLFATTYFNGYKGATTRPQSLFITKHNDADVEAKLIGGSVASLTIAQLQAINGTLSVTIDGVVKSGTVNLSAVASFSDAAAAIATALTIDCTYNSQLKVFIINSATFGATSTITFASGTAAAPLFLTEATGALVDNDTLADTTAAAMQRMLNGGTNFATITYIGDFFDTDALKEIAAWVTDQNGRFWFVSYGLDPLAIVPNSNTAFGAWLEETSQNGTTPIYGELVHAALACGYAASINFEQTNGRTTMAFRSQDGVEATVTDEAVAAALESNGYSYYGAWATANDRFVMFGNGAVSGDFKWVDNYLFQLFLNTQMQLADVTSLQSFGQIPYNAEGIAIRRAVRQDQINAGLNFGGIRAGVTLTEQQKAVINGQTGYDAAKELETKGWVYYVALPSAQVRAARGPFIEIFYYTDGSSLQRIELTSTNVQ